MPNYYVNRRQQSNGDHEVHHENCIYLPADENRIELGDFENCRDAVNKAKDHFDQVNGCERCSEPCHTS